MERQRRALRFRELARRKEALEGEIEKILGVVRGVCEGFEVASASMEGDTPEEEEGEGDEE